MLKMKEILYLGLILATLTATGCSNENSINTVAAVTLDTAPPSVPTGLAASSNTSVVKLAWDPNLINTDFQGFLVYRLAFDNAYLLTRTPIEEPNFVDQKPLGFPCGYAVSAVDQAGNESAWLEVRTNPGPDFPEIVTGK